MPQLDGKNAIVTGAASGIGYAIAKRFLREGARVMIADLDLQRGEQAVEDLKQFGEAQFLKTDVSKKLDVHNLVASTIEAFSEIDILVNNAAISDPCDLLTCSEESFDRVIAINLKGAFLLSQMVANQMVKRHEEDGGSGTILNISSVNGRLALPNQLAYCVSKGGMDQLTRVFAVALARYGIRVNAIAPGSISTDMLASLLDQDTMREQLIARTPLGRTGEPNEVASTAVFMVSSAASYMTGQVVYLDGGRTALNLTMENPPDE